MSTVWLQANAKLKTIPMFVDKARSLCPEMSRQVLYPVEVDMPDGIVPVELELPRRYVLHYLKME